MTQREREQTVRRHLYKYAQYKRDIEDYEQAVFGTHSSDESGIRGSGISDPTARLGIALAEPPRAMVEKLRWVYAIDDALVELQDMDAGEKHGLVYIASHTYGLDGKRHKRKENRDTALKIASDCHMSVRALYYRLGVITNVVIFHAAERNCFDREKRK